MKKFVLVFIFLTMLLTISANAKPLHITVNSSTVNTLVSHYYNKNVLMMPVRSVLEMMGGKITWNIYTNEATIYKDNICMIIKANSNIVTVSGKATKMPCKAVFRNKNLMVPIRFVIEAFKGSVEWSPHKLVVKDYWHTELSKHKDKEIKITKELISKYYVIAYDYYFNFLPEFDFENPSFNVGDYLIYVMYQVDDSFIKTPISKKEFDDFVYKRFRVKNVNYIDENVSWYGVKNESYAIGPSGGSLSGHFKVVKLRELIDNSGRTIYDVMFIGYAVNDQVSGFNKDDVKKAIVDGTITNNINQHLHVKFYYDNDELVILYVRDIYVD